MPNKSEKQLISDLRKQIALLKAENKKLKASFIVRDDKPKVTVPKEMEPVFKKAEKTVGKYFENIKINPSKGAIEINGQRYVLIRASALSYEFFNSIKNFYKDRDDTEAHAIANDFLFDMAHVIGMEDAKNFHHKMKLKDPLSKLSAGPVHFAYSGWAYVNILPGSNPSPDQNFYIKYTHPFSFEADSYISAGKKSKEPVCIMNAGYSSGWCQESFGIPLTAVELTCRAKGDAKCTFVMAPPDKIKNYVQKPAKKNKAIHIPTFLERKAIEEQLIKNQKILNEAQKIAKLGSWEFTLSDNSTKWSDELYNIFEIDKDKTAREKLFEAYLSRMPEEAQKELFFYIDRSIKKGVGYTFQHAIIHNNKTKWVYCSGVPVKDKKGKVIQLIGIAQDITDSMQQKENLEENLHEKETLLKEIHHRVKNNLQIISSLLNLQAYTINDEEAREKYRESIGRVKSMALIHEMLYQTKNLSNIDTKEYLNELTRFISETYKLNKNIKINLNIDSRIKKIDMNKAVPCGLLINELLSNCMKYAFKGKSSGVIQINFEIINKNPITYELSVKDNGVGFEKFVDFNNSQTLGLQLIHTLVEQLDGSIKFNSSAKGTEITIQFS